MAKSVDGFAGIAAAKGQASRALRLSGASAGLRASIGAPQAPMEHEQLLHWLQPAQQALSEAGCSAAWAEGQKMSEEQAVAYALQPAEPAYLPVSAAAGTEPERVP